MQILRVSSVVFPLKKKIFCENLCVYPEYVSWDDFLEVHFLGQMLICIPPEIYESVRFNQRAHHITTFTSCYFCTFKSIEFLFSFQLLQLLLT